MTAKERAMATIKELERRKQLKAQEIDKYFYDRNTRIRRMINN